MQRQRVKIVKVEEAPEFESEMVTLERIDLQKKVLMKSFTVRGKKINYGREILAHSMALRNMSFGVKGRY